ncbi:MAG: VOC family protein [Moorea sp. SIOASIH]|uniref:VOC family protein n=1 Tax=Moorena sp. SIOASIH TaxID=2607817 RepID=UPI0013BCD70D|nr:VOC family protein [Moorena sp. SIOASIH]NEO35211.1 VOC family protein [Moorena sp. SIOASIH]
METNQPSVNPNTPNLDELHIKRPCLVVADLERAFTLYRDILGFKLDYLAEASPDSYLYPVFQFPKTAQLKFASLSTEDEPRALALTEVKGIELPTPTTPYRLALVVRVKDLTLTIQKIRELGLDTIEPNYFTRPPNLNFTEQGFCDYDGHRIMLYDVTSG